MKSLTKLAVIALTIAVPFVVRADDGAAAPAEKQWEGSVSYDLSSEYDFRVVDLTGNNWLSSPGASVSAHGFTGWYWGGYGATDYQENDFGLDYSFNLADDRFSVSAGYIFYQYPDGDAHDTHELWASVGMDVFLSPTATWYWDFDEVGGSYLTLGVSHSFDLGEVFGLDESMSWTVDPSASLGIDFEYNSSSTDLNDLLFGVSTSLQLTEQLEIHGGVNLSIALSALNDISQGNEFWANLGASVSF